MSQNEQILFGTDGIAQVKQLLEKYWAGLERPMILEAGCGSGSNIRIPPGSHVTGIDISEEELAKNSVVSEKIVGDLETWPLGEGTYDLVVCWDVVEHLKRPQLAMENMARSVKPGGLLLLAFPNVHSVKAVVAKYTPLWFHRVVNRVVYGEKAGSPGLINFPTVLDPSISPRRMNEFAEKNGLRLEFARLGQSGMQRKLLKRFFLGERGTNVVDRGVKVLTFGKLSMKESDCICLFRKPKTEAGT
jgi:SAM-dependent methyltransferase